MDIYSFAPIAALLDLAYSQVAALAAFLTPLAGVSATALAIVLIVVVIRALLIPVARSQVRAEFTRRRLAPQLRELQRRYKSSPDVLQRKTMELYAAEKASPLAGCLPTLLQAPVLSTVYGLFVLGTIDGHPNTLLDAHLGGVRLGTSLVHLVTAGMPWPGLTVFAVLLVVIAVVAWFSRRATLANPPDASPAARAADPGRPPTPGLAPWLSWLPFLTVVFAATVPLAATLYLAVSTTWTLLERAILRRRFARQLAE